MLGTFLGGRASPYMPANCHEYHQRKSCRLRDRGTARNAGTSAGSLAEVSAPSVVVGCRISSTQPVPPRDVVTCINDTVGVEVTGRAKTGDVDESGRAVGNDQRVEISSSV